MQTNFLFLALLLLFGGCGAGLVVALFFKTAGTVINADAPDVVGNATISF